MNRHALATPLVFALLLSPLARAEEGSIIHLTEGAHQRMPTTGLNHVSVGDPAVAGIQEVEGDHVVVAAVAQGKTTLMLGAAPNQRRTYLVQVDKRTAVAQGSAPPTSVPGWFMSGGGRTQYQAVKDPAVAHAGHASVRLQPASPSSAGTYGTLMQSFSARGFLGKRVRLAAWIRTKSASGRADLWARVQASTSPSDGPGLGGGHRTIPEDSEWTRYELVFDMPPQGSEIQFGVGLNSAGTLWAADFTFQEVAKTTPLDDGVPLEPANLDFER
jgi:hypothetical protein